MSPAQVPQGGVGTGLCPWPELCGAHPGPCPRSLMGWGGRLAPQGSPIPGFWALTILAKPDILSGPLIPIFLAAVCGQITKVWPRRCE